MSEPKKPRAKKAPAGSELRIEYMTLDELKRLPNNPKAHDGAAIGGSISRFGFKDPFAMDEKTGFLSEGHGRLDDLVMRCARNEPAPEGIRVNPDGKWRVPVVRGGSFKSRAELERYVVAHNQTTIGGGWGDGQHLAGILKRASEANVPMEALGFGTAQVNRILVKSHLRLPSGAGGAGGDNGPELGALQFRVVIDCKDEADQAALMERLKKEGRSCRPLMS